MSSSPGINITNGLLSVPVGLPEMQCTRLFIEFLKLSADGTPVEEANRDKNHAIFKIDFDREYDNDYKGVRVDMQPDYNAQVTASQNGVTGFLPGILYLKKVKYPGESESTARSIEVPIRPGIRLYQLLNSFINFEVQVFSFVIINNKLSGCRDFVTQALYQMRSAGLLTSQIISTSPSAQGLRVRDAFDALGMRFKVYPAGHGSACPIDRGRFKYYTRVEEGQMSYSGTQAAAQLANRLAQ